MGCGQLGVNRALRRAISEAPRSEITDRCRPAPAVRMRYAFLPDARPAAQSEIPDETRNSEPEPTLAKPPCCADNRRHLTEIEYLCAYISNRIVVIYELIFNCRHCRSLYCEIGTVLSFCL